MSRTTRSTESLDLPASPATKLEYAKDIARAREAAQLAFNRTQYEADKLRNLTENAAEEEWRNARALSHDLRAEELFYSRLPRKEALIQVDLAREERDARSLETFEEIKTWARAQYAESVEEAVVDLAIALRNAEDES